MKSSADILFSIVIPTYQRAHLIKKTLQSILNQTYHFFEVIVVDDGGYDDTETVVKQQGDKRIKYFWKENQERGAARNFGVQRASGEYIFFLDSDDLIQSTYLAYAYELINKSGSPAALHIPYNILQNGVEVRTEKLPSDIGKQLFVQNYFACQIIIRKDVARSTFFSENRNFKVGEDWYYIIQVALKHSFVVGDRKLGFIVQHDTRGMNDISYQSVLKSKEIFITHLKEIPNLPGFIITNVDYELTNLASLQAVLQHKRKPSLQLFFKSLLLNPLATFRRRNFGIIKKFIFPEKMHTGKNPG